MGEERREFTDTTQWSPTGPYKVLKVSDFAGNVTARVGEPAAVVATIRVRASDEAEARELFGKVETAFKERGDRAEARAEFRRGVLDVFAGGKVTCDFDLTLPAGITLEVTLGAGRLETRGVPTVNVNLGHGDVDADAPRLLGKVGNGSVNGARPTYVDLDVGNGAVTFASAAALATLKLNMGNGAVTLPIGVLAEGADFKITLGNGSVTAAFDAPPTDCLVEVEALASDLRTDVPFNKEGGKLTFAAGEPRAKIKIKAAHVNVVFTTKGAA